MLAIGTRLGQLRPSDTANNVAYTPSVDTEVTAIYVCNTTGVLATFRLFHSRGTPDVFDQNTALYYDKMVPANDTLIILPESMGAGVHMQIGDKLAVRSSTADALTFTLYGVTTRISEERVARGRR